MGRSLAALPDEPRAAEDGEVLRHRRLRDRDLARELADRVLAPQKALEHPPPGRVGEGGHRLHIGHDLYKYMAIY
jgi:hypothetical protein